MRKSKIALALIMSLSLATSSYAMPSGGSVAGGTASVSGIVAGTLPNGTAINVGAGSALINWDSFSIAGGEKLFYDVANGGLALNYVTGSQMSELMGALTAKSVASTGTLMLVNPNGVLVGANAVINIPNLVLSSMDLDNANAFINDPTGTKLKLKSTGKNVSVEKNANAYGVAQIKTENLGIYADVVNLADSVYLVANKTKEVVDANNIELDYGTSNGIKAATVEGYAADALPSGGTVVKGEADISTSGIIKVNGNSIINWDSFDIGRTAAVNFYFTKSDANVLNRVTGNTLSHLYGTMKYTNAGGRVLLLNPNGILVGNNARIFSPTLTLSTLDIDNNDFDNLVAGKDVKFFTNTNYTNGGKGSIAANGLVESTGGLDIYGHEVNIGKDAIISPGLDTNIIAADNIVLSTSNKPSSASGFTFRDVDNIYLTSKDTWQGVVVSPPGGAMAIIGDRGYDIKEVNATAKNKITVDENAFINNSLDKLAYVGDVTIAGGSINMKKDSTVEGVSDALGSDINILAGNKITFTKDNDTDEYVTTIKADTSNTINMDGAVITNIGSDINVMGGSVTLKDTVLDNNTVSETFKDDGLVAVGDITVVAANDIEKTTVGGTVGHGYKTSENGNIHRFYGPIDEMEIDYEKKSVKAPMVKVYMDGVLINTIYDTEGFGEGKNVFLDKHTPKENTGTLKVTATANESLNITNSEINSANDAVLVGTSITKDTSSKIIAEGGTVNEQVLIKPTNPPSTNPPSTNSPSTNPPSTNPPSAEPPSPDNNGSVIIGGTTSDEFIKNWENRDDIIRITREISSALNAVPSNLYTVENIQKLITVVQDGVGNNTPLKDVTRSCMAVAQAQGLNDKAKANLVVALEVLDKEFATANSTVKKQVALNTIGMLKGIENYVISRGK